MLCSSNNRRCSRSITKQGYAQEDLEMCFDSGRLQIMAFQHLSGEVPRHKQGSQNKGRLQQARPMAHLAAVLQWQGRDTGTPVLRPSQVAELGPCLVVAHALKSTEITRWMAAAILSTGFRLFLRPASPKHSVSLELQCPRIVHTD